MLISESARYVFVVDDDVDILNAARVALRPLPATVELATTPQMLLDQIDEKTIDAVLLDMNFEPGTSSGAEGLHWLDLLVHRAPDISVVLMTAYGDVALAVEALKQGASDFVLKPWQNEKLVSTMGAAIALTRAKRGAAYGMLKNDMLELESEAQHGARALKSERFREISAKIHRGAPTDASILLLGESGTGKEVAAREIHRLSRRAGKPFVSVDLGALPENLFESELFGYRRGAFTGANSDRIGQVEAANGGTLFLDEIGNLPVHLQSKLLTLLERREVLPLGANKPVTVDIRLISATNLSPSELAQSTRFRQDLLFRVKTIELVLPPLRERREDIAPLLGHFLDFYARKYRVRSRTLTPAALAQLENYRWPGNIRELRQVAESATILAMGEQFNPSDFALAQPGIGDEAPSKTFDLEQLERQAIQHALEHFGGNISQAALALGLTRPALYRRISRHGL